MEYEDEIAEKNVDVVKEHGSEKDIVEVLRVL